MGQLIPGGWTVEQSDALKAHIAAGDSYAIAADKINRQFGTSFTRNSAIGRANRLGLSSTRKEPRRPKTIKARIVRVHSKSNAARVVTLSERAEYRLRCIEIECATSFEDRTGCRYPTGDGPFLFCNGPFKEGRKDYCTAHHALCWVPPRVMTDKAPVREVA